MSRDGKTVTYGIYPQTVVSKPRLIAKLNNIPAPEENGWYLYKGKYYVKLVAQPDVSAKYFSDGAPISDGKVYWFECQPIVWQILSNDNGGRLVVSEAILDFNRYDGRSNDYASSRIRVFLNRVFLPSAFPGDSSGILMTPVDNSPASTGFEPNQYACEDTQDKVFLLSYAEATNPSYGFSSSGGSDPTRIAKPTDYALALGVPQRDGASDWWLRSPDASSPRYAWFVQSAGRLSDIGDCYKAVYSGDMLNEGKRGVRPALRIKL